MAEVPKAVTDLAQGIEGLDKIVEEWAPDPPPINTSMSTLGRALVEDINPTPEQVIRVFGHVETILCNGTESEKDAVATGFLEAVVSAIDRNPSFRWMLDQAGPAARAYIDEWNRFCGTAD